MKDGKTRLKQHAKVVTYSLITLLAVMVGYSASADAPTTAQMTVQISQVTAETLFPKIAKDTDITVLDKYAGKKEKFNNKELLELLSSVGFKGQALKTAWAIVMRESHGNPLSHNTNSRTGDNSYGLFQINMIGNLGTDRRDWFGINSNNDLFNPVINARFAYRMTNEGNDWSSWGLGNNAYNDGANAPEYYNWLRQFPSGYNV